MKMTLTLITIMLCLQLSAPPSNTVTIFESEGTNPFENLFKAVCQVESSGNQFAVGDKHLAEWSYGICQIRGSRLNDYYKQTGVRYTTEDMFDPAKAKRVFLHYASQYGPYQFESISRAWNSGPNFKKVKMSKEYWQKVKKHL